MLTWTLAMLLTGLTAIAAPAAQDGPYNPTSEHPFGRPNPSAPRQLEQFAFMIGEFDCTDRIRQRDDSWNEFPATWHGYYFLNGLGIIDRYWNGRFATANTRVFDPASGKWKVTFFKMPGYGSGVWEGEKEGDQMVMKQENRRPDGTLTVSRLTFYDITEKSYQWKGERVIGEQATATWTSSCKRRK
ncbi:MAG: hypothetical protein V3T83_17640 [Acidobacteriota bacterium]